MEIAKEQVKKPFEHRGKLSELLSEQAELNAELNLDKREESVVIDDGNGDSGENYKMLPTQRKSREEKIIDNEDKIAAMQVVVLPDYEVDIEDMHKYGYVWDGMLPLTRDKAARLWGMGLQVYKLGADNTLQEIEHYGNFGFDTKEKAMFGIEKPVWKRFLESEKALPYFAARSQFAESAGVVTSGDMDSIDERFTIDFIEANYKERADLDDYLADKPKPKPEEMKAYTVRLLDEFSLRIWRDELKYYGWEERDVLVALANHLENEEMKAEAKQLTDRPFNAEKELLSRLAGFSEQEIENMDLAAFDDELTVLDKQPPYMLNESSAVHRYMDGVLLLRNDTTRNSWYVINDTSAKNKDGSYIDKGDKTDVMTVLAYNGLYDGNPMREFYSEEEARAYYTEKIKAIRDVRLKSAKNNPLVVGGGSERDRIFAIIEDYCDSSERIHGGTEDGIDLELLANNADCSIGTTKELLLKYGASIDGNKVTLNDELQFERRVISNRPNYSDFVSNLRRSYFALRKQIDYESEVIESVKNEYDNFQAEMLKSKPKKVFHNSYKINLYNEFSEVIQSGKEYLSDNDFKALYEDKGHILDSLYDDYIGSENYSVETYGDTAMFIKDYCESAHNEIYYPITYYGKDTENRAYYSMTKGISLEDLVWFEKHTKADMLTVAAPACYVGKAELEKLHIFYLNIGRDISEEQLIGENTMGNMMNAMDNYQYIYPLYLKTGEYAHEHYEIIAHRNSRKSNMECKLAIEEAIRQNYDGMRLNDGIEDKLIEQYGMERVVFVLANTVNERNWDGRYSRENKDWARTIPMSEDENVRSECCLETHPAVLDAFINRIHRKIKEQGEKKKNSETPKATEKLETLVNGADSKTPVYYYFNSELLEGGKQQFQVYLLNYGDDDIYPFFENGFATQDELEQAWNDINENGIYSSIDFHKSEPQQMIRMKNQNREKKEQEMAQDKFKNFTARGDKVLSIIKDRDDRNIAIIQREKIGDFVVAARYDTTDGTWAQGKYDFKTLEDAEQYRTEKYGFENTSDTIDKKWLTCKVSPEALIKKYQFNSRFMMPKGSGYEGYAYSIFNDRIKEGTITTDLKSDTRERALVIRIPDNKNVEISGNGKTVEIDPHEFISLVNETTSDKYEREQRYTVGFPPEAFIKEYDTSMLVAMPNDTKYKGYVYYLPKSVITEDKHSDVGTLIANIGESFKVTLRKGEERIELTAKEYLELVGDKKADKYGRDTSEIDEYREQQSEDDKKWSTVAISENAVIANYQNSTLFKMPKGEYAGYVYYIPSGMVRKDENGLSLRVPEDFTAHLKDGDNKKDLSAQEIIAAIEGKTDEDYESIYRKPSEEAVKQFEKVEGNLRRNVPAEMLKKPNWVVVRTRENNDTGRLDKFLINPHTGKFAESDNPETWADFDTACNYAKENGGVCLAYALEWDNDIACIDLDGCMQENGDFSEIAEQTFNAAKGSYCERSVSGKGLHIFGKTKGSDLRSFSKDKTMEYYQGGHFIALTGDYYGSSELKSFDTPEMQSILTSKLEKRTEWKHTGEGIEGLSSMDDREMLEKAFAAKNGDTVKRLYNGEDVRGNHSNSDMSLMNYLAFWSNHDIDQMLRVFSSSGLYRADKPQSYYEHTAIKAVKGTPCYTPPKASNNKPCGNGSDSGNSK